MGEIFIGGTNEYPYSRYKDPGVLSFMLQNRLKPESSLPDFWRDTKNWPKGAVEEWSDDGGRRAALHHREQLIIGYRAMRKELDRFQPDAVLIFNQEHHENFKDDILPAFCIYAAPTHRVEPHHMLQSGQFIAEMEWGEPADLKWDWPGNNSVARYLASHLLDEGFDVAIAYKGLHLERLAHTFTGGINYLNWDRGGMFPVIPIHLNCDGERNVAPEFKLDDGSAPVDIYEPRPFRAFDLGAALARVILESPYRVAILGGAAWSHGNLCAKNGYLFPDVEADVQLYDKLEEGDYLAWRNMPLSQLIDDGQGELLTWFPSVGALSVVQPAKRYTQFVPAHIFNSVKVYAAYAN